MRSQDVPMRPPMGWNSWDCYGTTVSEAEVLGNARFMATHLADYGWDTIVVDIDWSDPCAKAHGYNEDAQLMMDEFGRLVPDTGRFPSSAGGGGFAPLARQIHEMGLKFGIHIMRGIPRRAVEAKTPILGAQGVTADEVAARDNVCEWNPDMFGVKPDNPASFSYYLSIAALYAQWGVDFIKADDMLWPYQKNEIAMLSRALNETGRHIELSLSPGRDLSESRLEHLREHADMWRICDDLWDNWDAVKANFARFARWAPLSSAKGWADGDMLPLGHIGLRAEVGDPRNDRLTPEERRSLVTLWVIAKSPLMIGGDLPTTEKSTIDLFTNESVMEVHANSYGNHEIFRENGLILWSALGTGTKRYAAVFNIGDEASEICLDSENLGMPNDVGLVRELWSGAAVRTWPVTAQSSEARGVAPGSTAIELQLAAHGCALLECE